MVVAQGIVVVVVVDFCIVVVVVVVGGEGTSEACRPAAVRVAPDAADDDVDCRATAGALPPQFGTVVHQ